MSGIRLRILHETNPAKYFPALFLLERQGAVEITGAHRYSVIKEWLRAGLKDRTPLAERTRNALADLRFRLMLPWIAGETVVMGFAPWDWRLLLHRGLARRNRVIYHTSWHDWRIDRTPRQPRPPALKRALRRAWLAFVAHPNVTVVAVTPEVAKAVSRESGCAPVVIPHAVPAAFFEAGQARTGRRGPGLKAIFVGEVSEKKGIAVLLALLPALRAAGGSLTVVGTGEMAGRLADPHEGLDYRGPIRDRDALAALMAAHDVLVLPSRRTPTWEELFGIVVIEALAAGLAVLASDHAGPRGILRPADGAGLFDEADHDGLRDELVALARDPARLAALQARQVPIAGSYRIDSVSAQWREVLAP